MNTGHGVENCMRGTILARDEEESEKLHTKVIKKSSDEQDVVPPSQNECNRSCR